MTSDTSERVPRPGPSTKARVRVMTAAGSEDRTKLDTAANKLGLPIARIEAIEGRPASLNGVAVPSVSAWAFGGARVGEVSELFDDDRGYWLARLDSLTHGGDARFETVREEITAKLAREKAVDRLVPTAQQFAQAAASAGFDAAAKSAGLTVIRSPTFSRLSFVPGLGTFSKPIGAAFGLPVGAVSAPVKDESGVFVMRVERRVNADRAQFEKEVETLRRQRLQQLKQQRLRLFLEDLRKAAKVEDYRKDINATARRQEA